MNLSSTGQLNRCAIFNRIAHQHAIARVACVVDAAALNRILKESWWSRFLDKKLEPKDATYWYGFRIINEVFHIERSKRPELGLAGAMELVFDQEREADRAALMRTWDYLYSTSPIEKKRLLGNKPSFARDDFVLPLQAADLVAGLARRLASRGQSIQGLPTPWSDKDRKPILTFTFEHKEADIRRNFERVIQGQIKRRYWRSLS